MENIDHIATLVMVLAILAMFGGIGFHLYRVGRGIKEDRKIADELKPRCERCGTTKGVAVTSNKHGEFRICGPCDIEVFKEFQEYEEGLRSE